MKEIAGTRDLDLAGSILNQALKAWAPGGKSPAEIVAAFYEETAPGNPLEAMLIAQMAAAHSKAMEMFSSAKQSMIHDVEISKLKMADRLMRSFFQALDVLERIKRKGHQSVKVEHVHINSGAQAIVGAVNHG